MTDTFLGFDFGLRRIGVAVGQRLTGSAAPVDTVAARDGGPDWQHLDRIVADWRPSALVVGIPLHTDGSNQAMARRARRFADQLGQRYGLRVHEADERLTSHAAGELIAGARAQGLRRRTRKGDVDRIAATLILEHWLAARGADGD